MRKGVFALAWAAVFCFLLAAQSFAADEKQGTTEKTEWQKKMDDFQKRREQRIQELKKEKEASDARAGQKQEEQKQEKKELKDGNKGEKIKRNEPAP